MREHKDCSRLNPRELARASSENKKNFKRTPPCKINRTENLEARGEKSYFVGKVMSAREYRRHSLGPPVAKFI